MTSRLRLRTRVSLRFNGNIMFVRQPTKLVKRMGSTPLIQMNLRQPFKGRRSTPCTLNRRLRTLGSRQLTTVNSCLSTLLHANTTINTRHRRNFANNLNGILLRRHRMNVSPRFNSLRPFRIISCPSQNHQRVRRLTSIFLVTLTRVRFSTRHNGDLQNRVQRTLQQQDSVRSTTSQRTVHSHFVDNRVLRHHLRRTIPSQESRRLTIRSNKHTFATAIGSQGCRNVATGIRCRQPPFIRNHHRVHHTGTIRQLRLRRRHFRFLLVHRRLTNLYLRSDRR